MEESRPNRESELSLRGGVEKPFDNKEDPAPERSLVKCNVGESDEGGRAGHLSVSDGGFCLNIFSSHLQSQTSLPPFTVDAAAVAGHCSGTLEPG